MKTSAEKLFPISWLCLCLCIVNFAHVNQAPTPGKSSQRSKTHFCSHPSFQPHARQCRRRKKKINCCLLRHSKALFIHAIPPYCHRWMRCYSCSSLLACILVYRFVHLLMPKWILNFVRRIPMTMMTRKPFFIITKRARIQSYMHAKYGWADWIGS